MVTVGLILANTLVWIWQVTGSPYDEDAVRYGYYPCAVLGPCIGEYARLRETSWYDGTFTSMFMHGGWAHFLGNMLFLWIFGNNIEDSLGRVRFLAWYLAGGVAAIALQTFVTLNWGTDLDASIPNIGASGAISAVMGAYFVLLPRARVLTLIVVFPRQIPAWLFLGFWIGFQLWAGGYSLLHPEEGGGIAFFAHIGGFVFGAATIQLLVKRRPVVPY
jgi:membrane associated rhomboid family serine protease